MSAQLFEYEVLWLDWAGNEIASAKTCAPTLAAATLWARSQACKNGACDVRGMHIRLAADAIPRHGAWSGLDANNPPY